MHFPALFGKQPILPSQGRWPDRTLRPVVGQLQPPIQKNVHQPAFLPDSISQRRAKHALWHGVLLVFCFRPDEEGLCRRLGSLQPGLKSLAERKTPFFVVLLKRESLVAEPQSRLPQRSVPHFFWQAFECVCKLPAHMRSASRHVIPGPGGLVVVQHDRPWRIPRSPVNQHVALLPGFPSWLLQYHQCGLVRMQNRICKQFPPQKLKELSKPKLVRRDHPIGHCLPGYRHSQPLKFLLLPVEGQGQHIFAV